MVRSTDCVIGPPPANILPSANAARAYTSASLRPRTSIIGASIFMPGHSPDEVICGPEGQMHKLRSVARNAAAALTLLSLAACAGKGCSCVQPIKGGFPVDKRRDNAIQIRATDSMFKFIGANGSKLVPGLIGGNMFTVPPSCGGSTEICCRMPNQVCQL